MPFKKLDVQSYPRRLWGLYGFPGSGKSTFAAQMRAPLLTVDADHRFDEVARLVKGDVYQLSDRPADNVDPEAIAAALRENMPGADVRTICVDSLTAILAPLVTQAILDNEAGRNKNRMAGFKDKALAMRLLLDSVTAWGCDVLWIWHLQTGRNANAEEQTTATVSRTELARLTRGLNMQLRILEEAGRRGIRVDWARRGRWPVTVWDDAAGPAAGRFAGMPEKIERAVYDGLTEEDQKRIEGATPTSFPNPEAAIAWAVDAGGFEAIQHARNAYDLLKQERAPKTAPEMWRLWVEDVQGRVLARAAAAAAPGDQAPADGANGDDQPGGQDETPDF
jgi:hypothetical protein